jgi:hypothetical protein
MTSVNGYNLVSAPCCGVITSTPRYASINSMAYEHWTDGRRVHTLMPPGAGLRRCVCGAYFLLRNAEKVGFEQEQVSPSAAYVEDEELQTALNAHLSKDVEIIVRRRYWQFLNDPYREAYRIHRDEVKAKAKKAQVFKAIIQNWMPLNAKRVPPASGFTVPDYVLSDEQSSNMLKLLTLLEGSNPEGFLEVAEIYRELSRFEEATEALTKYKGDGGITEELISKLVLKRSNAPHRYQM